MLSSPRRTQAIADPTHVKRRQTQERGDGNAAKRAVLHRGVVHGEIEFARLCRSLHAGRSELRGLCSLPDRSRSVRGVKHLPLVEVLVDLGG
jgi:hypothetical protein